MDCASVRKVSLDAKELIEGYFVTGLLLGFATINFLYQYLQNKVVAKFSAYEHLSPESNEETVVRCLQLWFGSIIAISGLAFLFYTGLTGCNANEIYLIYIGGFWLVVLDAHEFVRRWPLRAPVLAHHLTVFMVGLAFTEWGILPPNPGDPIQWTVVLLLTFIGVAWISDFFHVVFRTSCSLVVIERCRLIYLYVSPIRLFNTVNFGYMSVDQLATRNYFGGTLTGLLGIAYVYNTYKAVTFVKRFSCADYFLSHQAKWSEEHSDPSSRSMLLTPAEARSTRVSFVRTTTRPSKRWSLGNALAISTEQRPSLVKPGSRGDASVFNDLEAFVTTRKDEIR